MNNQIENTEEVKTGELTVQDYKIVGFDESVIPSSRIHELKEKFVPMLQAFDTHNQNRDSILEEFESYKKSGEAVPKSLLDRAKRHRLDIAKIRTTTEKGRKSCNEDLNKAKSGNDALANYIKENISSDEKEMAEIELHNEKIEEARLKEVQAERAEIVKAYGFTEDVDFSGMAQTIFDSFVAGEKVKFNEREEANRKQEVRVSRQTQCLNISEFIPNYEAIDLAELSEDNFNSMVDNAKLEKFNYEEAKRIEKEAEAKRQKEIEEENERLKNEKAEADKKAEAERLEREAKEKAEKERQAEAQKIADAQREKIEREAREARESEEAKTREAEQAKQAEEEAKRKLKEAQEAEAKRIEEIKALAETSKEITLESIEKTIAEGKTIFVQVVSVEKIEGQAGIFIQKSEK